MNCYKCNKKLNIKKEDIIIIQFNKYSALLNKYIDLYSCEDCFFKKYGRKKSFEYLTYNKYKKSVSIDYFKSSYNNK